MVARRPALAEAGIAAKGHHGAATVSVDGEWLAVTPPLASRMQVPIPPGFGPAAAAALSADGRTAVVAPSSGRLSLFVLPDLNRPLGHLPEPVAEWREIGFADEERSFVARGSLGTFAWPRAGKAGELEDLARASLPVEGGRPIELPPSLACDLLLAACQNAVD